MPALEYAEALKKAQKEFRVCTARGEYPYLPALDDFLPKEEQLNTANLGTVQVPMEFIAGSKSGGRTQAFARNFMPLMNEDSEFASKWTRLCQAH